MGISGINDENISGRKMVQLIVYIINAASVF
jgi:hypothetical protein